jgi:hypothetical protein
MGCGTSKAATSAGAASTPRKPMTAEEKRKALEKEAEKKIYRQKEMLRERSLPMIETGTSCEDLVSLAEQVESSARSSGKIHRLQMEEVQARIKKDKLAADAQKRWMVFSNLDTVNEADMVHLIQFMKVAMKSVPTYMENLHDKSLAALTARKEANDFADSTNRFPTISEVPQEKKEPESDVINVKRLNSKEYISALRMLSSESVSSVSRFDSDVSASTNNSISASRQNSTDSIFRINNIAISNQSATDVTQLSSRRLNDFEIPSGFVTPTVAEMVLNVYKKEGALSTKSVHKILRLSYRALKKLPNITYMSISGDERLTVVGDIHGNDWPYPHAVELVSHV